MSFCLCFLRDVTLFSSNIKKIKFWDYLYFCSVVLILARMGKDRGVHRVLVGKPEGKRPLWETKT